MSRRLVPLLPARAPAVAAALASLVLLAACPPTPPAPDAGDLDASLLDAPRADTNDDALACTLRCASTQERCCFEGDGVAACINVATDVENCGLCGLDCVATHRGTRCESMQCACGDFPVGCTGDLTSYCCPAAADGRSERCANLGRDAMDCGECGRTCLPTQANRCEGGSCRCGTDGMACAGTDESLCCVDVFEVASCVDTTQDPLHCGGCNLRCGAFENCIDGVCVDFTLRDAGPAPDANVDGGPPDAGRPDAGRDAGPDAGSPDAGSPDAGSPDAGPDAGGSDAAGPDLADAALDAR